MNTEQIYRLFLNHSNIVTDSRKITHDCIFFALKGPNFNGNNFAFESIRKGAAYAIVDEIDDNGESKIIKVENVLRTLQKLANHHRKRLQIPILAITGTNGKTTTKELVTAVLKQKIKTTATVGNLNNHIGVPLTLLAMDENTEIGVVEMGANHPGEIETLCKIAEPNYGIITNIGKAHLEGFGSFEGVIKTKGELYNFLEKNKGTLFYNSDNKILRALIKNQKTITYSITPGSTVFTEFLSSSPNLSIVWKNPTTQRGEKLEPKSIEIFSNLYGRHNHENIMAAIAVGVFFKVSSKKIKAAIEGYLPKNNRSQLTKTQKGNMVVFDAYNANPTSMKNAVSNFFPEINIENKVLILGDMLELGKYSNQEHQQMVKLIQLLGYRNVFLVGDEFSKVKTDNNFQHFYDSKELKEFIKANPIGNCYILVKGSRGIQLEKIADQI